MAKYIGFMARKGDRRNMEKHKIVMRKIKVVYEPVDDVMSRTEKIISAIIAIFLSSTVIGLLAWWTWWR